MKSKILRWNPKKIYHEKGNVYKICAKVSLDDDCNNMHADFSITADVYERTKNGRWVWVAGGCQHDLISKHFPELKRFIPLHLCSHDGSPMYPVENGSFHVYNSSEIITNDYLRLSDGELQKLNAAPKDHAYFKYMLFHLGIVARWQKEADEFIRFLEEKTGVEWENPYTPEQEHFRLEISAEEKAEIETKISNGYYSEEAIAERNEARRIAKIEAQREEILAKYNKTEQQARNERDIKLYILDSGLPTDNVIYYNHTNKVVFNWKDYDKKITQEQFVDFINQVDYSKLPDGVEFSIK
ncbi:MAG: hypothetical protein HXN79_01370 [Prevotella pallens]|uniref:hypothetical protein n=1 Tax=Prevotella pallens TaxID=60133 RepID=UPI001CB5C6EC|nr:hypothetical protein [Prevotella pallens]MBF1486963.1 hypothetical protein [Prevotella pallens]